MNDYVYLVYQTDSTTTMDVLRGIGKTEDEANEILEKLNEELKRNADIDPLDGEEIIDTAHIKKKKMGELFPLGF